MQGYRLKGWQRIAGQQEAALILDQPYKPNELIRATQDYETAVEEAKKETSLYSDVSLVRYFEQPIMSYGRDRHR